MWAQGDVHPLSQARKAFFCGGLLPKHHINAVAGQKKSAMVPIEDDIGESLLAICMGGNSTYGQ